jgi:hypothetical protein
VEFGRNPAGLSKQFTTSADRRFEFYKRVGFRYLLTIGFMQFAASRIIRNIHEPQVS